MTTSVCRCKGSGTFAVEAAIGTLVPRRGCVLVPDNGAYCARIVKILQRLGIAYVVLKLRENEAVGAAAIEDALNADSRITHVALVHLETTVGLLNPLDAIAEVCRRHGKSLIVDAMSSFGALPIDPAPWRHRRADFGQRQIVSKACLEWVLSSCAAPCWKPARDSRRRSRSICMTSTTT